MKRLCPIHNFIPGPRTALNIIVTDNTQWVLTLYAGDCSKHLTSIIAFSFQLYTSDSQRVIPQPAASASPGNLGEKQVLRPCPRPTESEILEVSPAVCVLSSPSGNSDAG